MNNHLRWTSEILRSFYEQGVRNAIISPGSRSTPLTLAAAIHPGIKKQVVLDERSAAFMALGIGKATGIPAILICTSGTAAANYLPAIIEARESGVPMIVLTADRPPQLRGIGSSQTVDQIKLYGGYTVFFHEAGEPGFEDDDLKRLNYLAAQTVRASIDSGGAAHINFPFRKPLEPAPDQIQIEKEHSNIQAKKKAHLPLDPILSRHIQFSQPVTDLISSSERPLIIAGPANPHQALSEQVRGFVNDLQVPVLAEPGSQVSSIPGQIYRFEQFLKDPEQRQNLRPDLILRFGDQPFTKSILVALEEWSDLPVIHFTGRKPAQDHAMSVNYRIDCKPSDTLDLNRPFSGTDSNWVELWNEAEKSSGRHLEETLSNSDRLTDGHLFHHLAQMLSERWNVMLSNSFIPRDMALFSGSNRGQFVNRGAAGIDGILSTAIGISIGSGAPTCCITGDLAFLHDSNALLSLDKINTPMLIVVVNNGGGNIFRMLPIADNQEYFNSYFATPQDADLQKMAEVHRLNYQKCSSLNHLVNIEPDNRKGVQIVEIVTDADAGMAIRNALWGV